MNIYKPYEALADFDDCLHLKLSDASERIYFTTYRIIPLFLLLFTWFVLQQMSAEMPMGWKYFIAIFSIAVSLVVFLKTYITEIKFTGDGIFILQKSSIRTKEINIKPADIESISLSRRKGKSSGAFFTLHTRNKKSYLIIRITSLYADEKHTAMICERLKQVAHISEIKNE